METKLEKLVALIVDRSQESATQLARSLQPEIPFESVDHTNSLLKAVHAQAELKAQVIFISSDFPTDEVAIFAKDVNKLNPDNYAVIIYVMPEIGVGFDRNSLTKDGINFVISTQGTEKDKEGLLQVLAEFTVQAEVKRKVISVKRVMDMLLKEVNKVAESKRRGSIKELTINSIPAEFVAAQTSWNEQVQTEYFEMLMQRTVESEAPIADELLVPQDVLDKQLPHLESDTYRGISHRVWTKLQKKHGIKKKVADAPDDKNEAS